MGEGPDESRGALRFRGRPAFGGAKAPLDLTPLRGDAQRIAQGFRVLAGEKAGEQVDDDARRGIELVVAVALEDGDGCAQLALAGQIDRGERLEQGEAIRKVRAMGIEIDHRAEVFTRLPRFIPGQAIPRLGGLIEQGDAGRAGEPQDFRLGLVPRLERLRHVDDEQRARRFYEHRLEQTAFVDEKRQVVLETARHNFAEDGERVGMRARCLEFERRPRGRFESRAYR